MAETFMPLTAEGDPCVACGGPDEDSYNIARSGQNPHGARNYQTDEDESWVCGTMHLVRNHCIYQARIMVDPGYRPKPPHHCNRKGHPVRGHRTFDMDCARLRLADYIERAKQVWPEDRQGWLARYEVLASESPAGQAARLTAMVLA